MAGVMDQKYRWKVTSGNFGFSVIGDGILLSRYPTKLDLLNGLENMRSLDPVGFSTDFDPKYEWVELIQNSTGLRYRFTLIT
jgi:hypothetical protein